MTQIYMSAVHRVAKNLQQSPFRVCYSLVLINVANFFNLSDARCLQAHSPDFPVSTVAEMRACVSECSIVKVNCHK